VSLTCFFFSLSFFFFFLPGILIGYSVNRKSESPSCPLENSEVQENQDVNYDPPAPSMDWSDIVQLLNDKLSSENINKILRYL